MESVLLADQSGENKQLKPGLSFPSHYRGRYCAAAAAAAPLISLMEGCVRTHLFVFLFFDLSPSTETRIPEWTGENQVFPVFAHLRANHIVNII